MDVDQSLDGTLRAHHLDDARTGLHDLGDESIWLSSDERPVSHRECGPFLFRCPSPSAACLPRSIEGDTGPHPDRSALCGAGVCLASATRGIRGMGYRAARRRFRNVFSTGDSGLPARESECSRRANPRQILLGLLWIFHFGAALKRDCGHPAGDLAHPGCVSPATIERRFHSVSGKDSVPIAERSRWSAGSLHWQAGGNYCIDSPRELVLAASNFAVWIGLLLVEDCTAFQPGSVLRTDTLQDRSRSAAIPTQHDRGDVGYGRGGGCSPAISLGAGGMAGVCGDIDSSAGCFS